MTVPVVGFARPELLLLLAALPIVSVLVALAYRARVRALRSFGGATALVSRSGPRWWLKAALVVVALASLVIALAGPYVDLRAREARRLGVDIVLAVDVSQSMAARDVEPDRLRAARHFAEELGRQMVGSRVALVLFAGQGTVRYPPTTDPRILGEVLDNSGRGVRLQQGSSLRSGLESSLGAFPADPGPLRQRAIVFVSDGEITNSDIPEAGEIKGARIFTVGVGTTAGGEIPTYDANTGKFTGYLRDASGAFVVSRLVEVTLRSLAERGGGRYFQYAGGDAVIGDLARELRTMEAVEPLDDAGAVPDERSAPFIAFGVALLLLEWLISDRRPMPAPRSVGGRPVARRGRRILGIALGSSLLWASACGDAAISNDTANALFAAGDHAGALAAYRDLQIDLPDSPELAVNAANSLHMLAEYPKALPEYGVAIEGKDLKLRAIAQYDRGNTLFRMSRYEDARDAYREVLRIDPTDRDAKFNLEIIARILAGRPGQPGQQSGPGQGQGASPGPAQGPGQSGQPSASGSPQPGQNPGQPQEPTSDPANSSDPNDEPSPALRPALDDFRRGLTIDEALRVLDALAGEQRGVGQLLEGPRRGLNGEY